MPSEPPKRSVSQKINGTSDIMRKNTSVPAIVVARWEANIRYASLPRLNVRLMTLSCSFLISCILCNSLANYTIALWCQVFKIMPTDDKSHIFRIFSKQICENRLSACTRRLTKGNRITSSIFCSDRTKTLFQPKKRLFLSLYKDEISVFRNFIFSESIGVLF